MTEEIKRVDCTPAAAKLVAELRARQGDLLFHQSGGCCDGSSPMCFARGELRIGERDVLLGVVAGTPFFMGSDQFELWKHTALTLDVVPGRGSGFSLEAPHGVRFMIRSRVFETREIDALEAAGGPLRGPSALATVI
ncbi:DUF779 domain-containing protein [soil metagenome]